MNEPDHDCTMMPRRVRLAFYFAVLLVAAIFCMPPARASLLVTNATFLTMKPGEDAPVVVGYMLVDDNGKIVAIAPGAPPAETTATTTLDATNKIIMPGLFRLTAISGKAHFVD
jgi:hypothetical protein